MELTMVTNVGQVNKGDLLLIKQRGKDKFFPAMAKVVNHKGTNDEDIVISVRKNFYILISMYLKGESWIDRVYIVPNGTIYSISNTTRELT